MYALNDIANGARRHDLERHVHPARRRPHASDMTHPQVISMLAAVALLAVLAGTATI